MRAQNKSRALAASVVVVAVLVAALLLRGGDDDAAEGPAFRQAAQGICLEAQDRVAALPTPRGLGELAAVSDDVGVIADRSRRRLAALDAPSRLAPGVSRLLKALDDQVRLIRGVARAARARERDRARRLIARGAAADRATARAAARLRLPACGALAAT